MSDILSNFKNISWLSSKKTPTKAETLHKAQIEALGKAAVLLAYCSGNLPNEKKWFECASLSGEIMGLLDQEKIINDE
jgi:hypothetical protein